jgi:phospholipid/cholesterol/gamma-HCH transport system ATP-binding protein
MIKIENLSKSFNSLRVLNNLSLTIKEGETKVIIGRSGCGKSVLLKHIMGLIKPDEGSIFIEGRDITKLNEEELKPIRMKMAFVFQGGALFDSLTVAENVGFVLKEHYRLPKEEISKRVSEALSLVELDRWVEELLPNQLSGGMKKRVAIARAICMRPKIILYDEPTTGIDPVTADSINNLIRNLHDKLKVTSVVVTHDMRSAYKIADTIAMLHGGRIIYEGSPSEIQNTKDPIVFQFINGFSKMPIN